MRVEIYKLQNDGSQKIIAECELKKEDSAVECKGDDLFTKNLAKNGIVDYSGEDRRALYFKDGIQFLEQLKNNFKSGYLNASEVM